MRALDDIEDVIHARTRDLSPKELRMIAVALEEEAVRLRSAAAEAEAKLRDIEDDWI